MIYKLIAIVLLSAALLGIGLLQESLTKGRLTEKKEPIVEINGMPLKEGEWFIRNTSNEDIWVDRK